MKKPQNPGPLKSPDKAMILAAGLGKRMRPLTDKKPKAMVEVLGKPLIGHMLDWLEPLDLKKIVVNTHYKPKPLKDYLSGHKLKKIIVLSDEKKKILDTGGGIKKALGHFKGDPFFAANCDSFFDPGRPNPFQSLQENYSGRGALLLLALTENAVGYTGRGDFRFADGRHLRRPGEAGTAPFVFAGLQILDPALFEGLNEQVFSLNKIYDLAIDGGLLKGAVTPTRWYHIGTPETLEGVEAMLKEKAGS